MPDPFRIQGKLLAYFRQNEGKVLSRDELQLAVWGFIHDPRSRCIDQTVALVRKTLSPEEKIQTVHREGYRFKKE